MNTNVQPDGSIRIYPTRWKLLPLLLGAVVFVALGVWLVGPHGVPALVHVYHAAVGMLSVVFFGACAVVITGRIVKPSPAVVLNREGITDTTSPFAIGFLSWSEVAFVSIYAIRGQRTLGVFLKDPGSTLLRLGAAKARYMRLNLRMGLAPVNVSQTLLPMPAEELLELIHTRYGVEKKLAPVG